MPLATAPRLALPAALLSLAACAPFSQRVVHDAAYDAAAVPAAPDYDDPANWAALPSRTDPSDAYPEDTAFPPASTDAPGPAVFFLHPTIYTDAPDGRFPWNGSVTDAELNARVDESTIRLQASAFNAAGPVYAPRYRQAHISAYYTEDTLKARAAFDTAYADVRRAFEWFLRKHNPDEGILIAGHSQGTTHGKRLVRDYFDPGGPQLAGEGLSPKLVTAYLVGIPVAPDDFASVPVCTYSTQTGCFVSWRTWQRPATPYASDVAQEEPAVVVNPLTWTTDTTYAPASLNPGGTLRKLRLIEELSDAQVQEGILWINRPDFFGERVIRMDNWHAADINLFYESVRGNAVARAAAYRR